LNKIKPRNLKRLRQAVKKRPGGGGSRPKSVGKGERSILYDVYSANAVFSFNQSRAEDINFCDCLYYHRRLRLPRGGKFFKGVFEKFTMDLLLG